MFSRNSKLTGEIEYYYSADPAFDRETRRSDVEPPPDARGDWQPPLVFDYKRWSETGDEACLPRKTGAQPVKIVCKRLTPAARAYVEDLSNMSGQGKNREAAFLALVRIQVQRLEPHPPDDPPIKRVTVDGHSMLSDEWAGFLYDYDESQLFYELVARLYQEMQPTARS